MRTAWLLVTLAACGSAKTGSVDNAAKAPALADPYASHEAMVKFVFAKATTGDTDALVGIANVEQALAKSVVCQTKDGPGLKQDMKQAALRTRIQLRELAGRGRGHRIELASLGEPRERDFLQGDEPSVCKVNGTVTHTKYKLTIRVDGKETSGEAKLVDAGGRVYLYGIEVDEAVLPRQPLVERYGTLVKRLCACKDAACAEPVAEEHEGDAMDHGAAEASADTPPEELRRLQELRTQLEACAARMK